MSAGAGRAVVGVTVGAMLLAGCAHGRKEQMIDEHESGQGGDGQRDVHV